MRTKSTVNVELAKELADSENVDLSKTEITGPGELTCENLDKLLGKKISGFRKVTIVAPKNKAAVITHLCDDTEFTECQFRPSHIKIPLRFPYTDNIALVSIHTSELIFAYNKKFHTHKKPIVEILSVVEAERKNRNLFLEKYCFEQAIKQKISLSSQDANYFIRHNHQIVNLRKVILKDEFVLSEHTNAHSTTMLDRVSDLIKRDFKGTVFNSGIESPDFVLNLVKDKKAAIVKLAKDTTHRSLQGILKEAKKSTEKLAEAGIEKTNMTGYPALSAQTLIEKINAGHRFFRGVFIQGDLDLSQLKNKNISRIDFGNAVFGGKINFSGCRLEHANFQGAEFTQAVTYELHNKKIVVSEDNVKILYDLFY